MTTKKETTNEEVDVIKTESATDEQTEIADKNKGFMASALESMPNPPLVGDLVEGDVIGLGKNTVYIDLPPFGTGIIYGREYLNVRDVMKNTNIGDKISAKVVDMDNEDGYIELSLKEARQAIVWTEAEKAMKEKQILELPIKEANKGGLIIEWQGIVGFLPASQLKTEHYPRVEGGDKDRILDELKKLTGQKLSVSIIGVSPKEGKLIFSEKNIEQKERQHIVEKYHTGDEVSGEITGIVDFGVFVKLEEGLEGLVHISELSWSLVDDPRKLYKVGEKINVKVIEADNGKISLSIKALEENPWKEAINKYKKGDEISAVVIKFNKHGALASVEEGVAGLVHISEFGTESNMKEALELGKSYKFKINVFEPSEQKMTLSLIK